MKFLLSLLKIYKAFIRFSFSKASEFRFDSLFRIFMDAAFYLQFYLLLHVTFEITPALGGWGREQTMMFFAICLVVDALFMVFIDRNTDELPGLVVKGGFDYYLLRPIPTLFQTMLREISIPSMCNLLFACLYLCYTFNKSSLTFTPFDLVVIVGLIINGFFLMGSLRLLFGLGVFWGMSERAFLPIHWGLAVMFEKPYTIYSGTIRAVALTILPFALIASLPTELLYGSFDRKLTILFHIVGVSIGFYAFMLLAWRVALKNYSSASS
jgi:ABC-2 type transport system permease protein